MNGGLTTFPCPTCGAHLTIDGSTQTPRCSYCGTEALLPIEIWTRLHPAPAPTIPLANGPPRGAPSSPLVRALWLVAFLVLTGVFLGVYFALSGTPATTSKPSATAKVGDACLGRRAACSVDKKADLVCGAGDAFVVSETCKGPGGCSVKPDGKTIDCDYTLADPNDPCDVADGACSVDRKSEVHCGGGKWSVVATCKGPSGCTIAPASGGAKTLSCDDHIADVGDACFSSDRVACSTDGKSYLSCVGQKFAVAKKCTGPKGCKATHVVGTDNTEMECDGSR